MYIPDQRIVHIMFNAAYKAALKAGDQIMKIYCSDDDRITVKSDNSLMSTADQMSHRIIEKQLASTRIPIISEEGRNVDYEERRSWELFWLIDPLDGTRHFIKKNKEFTVNIALLFNSNPVVGLVYAPALGKLYFASKGEGAYSLAVDEMCVNFSSFDEIVEKSQRLPLFAEKKNGEILILTSTNHYNQETKSYISEKKRLGKTEIITRSVGSSLKMCLIASGEADAYPRHATSYEWDTAAAQVILEEVGCTIQSFDTGEKLLYNKECLTNPHFICYTKKHEKLFF